MGLIEEAITRGQRTLSEHASKKFLASYGIPTCKEFLVKSEKEVLEGTAQLGYPVVLKACGPELTHKTEGNLIRLHLKTPDEVRAGYKELMAQENPQWEGVLVQEMIRGHRELVIGLIRDSQFGPCVMFGLGGILTEVLNDVTFRVAPLEKYDAMEMVNEIRAKKILEAFRGEPPVDLEVLSHCLITLGKIGLENPMIKEIDINPLKVRDGYPIAVDALVVLSDHNDSMSTH
jgi:acetyl-CoA synthetase (ADP-forming)